MVFNDYQVKQCLSKVRTKCFDCSEPEPCELNRIDVLKSYLEARQMVKELSNSSKLQDYGFISKDIIELCKSHKSFYRDIFYGSECPYKVELTCKYCGNTFIRELGKGKIYNLIEDKVDESDVDILFCESCAQEHIVNELNCRLLDIQNNDALMEEKRLNKIQHNTEYYIDNFLNPECSWVETFPQNKRFYELSAYSVNEKDIKDHIKGMSYYDFLNTPYWKAIAQQVKYKAGFKCQLCGSNQNLNVHHRTYEHHGEELKYMKSDLIVLCKHCHEKFHDIVD